MFSVCLYYLLAFGKVLMKFRCRTFAHCIIIFLLRSSFGTHCIMKFFACTQFNNLLAKLYEKGVDEKYGVVQRISGKRYRISLKKEKWQRYRYLCVEAN